MNYIIRHSVSISDISIMMNLQDDTLSWYVCIILLLICDFIKFFDMVHTLLESWIILMLANSLNTRLPINFSIWLCVFDSRIMLKLPILWRLLTDGDIARYTLLWYISNIYLTIVIFITRLFKIIVPLFILGWIAFYWYQLGVIFEFYPLHHVPS